MTIVLNVLSLIVASVGTIVAVLILLRIRRPVEREMEAALRDELATAYDDRT